MQRVRLLAGMAGGVYRRPLGARGAGYMMGDGSVQPQPKRIEDFPPEIREVGDAVLGLSMHDSKLLSDLLKGKLDIPKSISLNTRGVAPIEPVINVSVPPPPPPPLPPKQTFKFPNLKLKLPKPPKGMRMAPRAAKPAKKGGKGDKAEGEAATGGAAEPKGGGKGGGEKLMKIVATANTGKVAPVVKAIRALSKEGGMAELKVAEAKKLVDAIAKGSSVLLSGIPAEKGEEFLKTFQELEGLTVALKSA